MPFAAACAQLQDLGFDKAEIWINESSDQLKLSRVVASPETVAGEFRDASRLTPVAIFLEEPPESETLEDFEAIVAFAKQLKIAQITILASPMGTPFNSEIDRLRERNILCVAEGIRLSILTRSGLLTEDPHTAVELCQSVKGLGVTLDPSYYTCSPRGEVNHDFVFPVVSHLHLRDTSRTEMQVPAGLGEVDYNRIVSSLRNEKFNRTLSVDLLPNTMLGEERLLEMRKLRRLLETLL